MTHLQRVVPLKHSYDSPESHSAPSPSLFGHLSSHFWGLARSSHGHPDLGKKNETASGTTLSFKKCDILRIHVYSILFHSIAIYAILFHSMPLLCSIQFRSIGLQNTMAEIDKFLSQQQSGADSVLSVRPGESWESLSWGAIFTTQDWERLVSTIINMAIFHGYLK